MDDAKTLAERLAQWETWPVADAREYIPQAADMLLSQAAELAALRADIAGQQLLPRSEVRAAMKKQAVLHEEQKEHLFAINQNLRDENAALRAERDARIEEAFREGYCACTTYNDKETSDVDTEWAKAAPSLMRAARSAGGGNG